MVPGTVVMKIVPPAGRGVESLTGTVAKPGVGEFVSTPSPVSRETVGPPTSMVSGVR